MNRDRAYLQDITDSASAAEEYLLGISRETFHELREKQSAIIRELEILGEAARRLSDQAKQAMPEVPWRKLIGMRNILIHQYDNVDLDLVYDTVTQFLPSLVEQVKAFLARQGNS